MGNPLLPDNIVQTDVRSVKAARRKKILKQPYKMAALICYYYPQYSYEEALELSTPTQNKLINTVRIEQLEDKLLNLDVLVASKSKKGLPKFRREIKKQIKKLKD